VRVGVGAAHIKQQEFVSVLENQGVAGTVRSRSTSLGQIEQWVRRGKSAGCAHHNVQNRSVQEIIE